jgi:phage repressor protein C with HTH and peptisase S24 domain
MGFSLDDLARRTGISKPYLSLIETGRVPNPPSDEKLVRLEQTLGFPSGELLTQAHLFKTPKDVRALLQGLLKNAQAHSQAALTGSTGGAGAAPDSVANSPVNSPANSAANSSANSSGTFSGNVPPSAPVSLPSSAPGASPASSSHAGLCQAGSGAQQVGSDLSQTRSASPKTRPSPVSASALSSAAPSSSVVASPALSSASSGAASLPSLLDPVKLTAMLRQIVDSTAGNVEPLPIHTIPVINKVSAGYPKDFTDLSYPKGVADAYVSCPDVADPDAFAARVFGDSMTPKYRPGDIVIFSPRAPVNSGDDCFIRFESGNTTFKRVFFETDDTGNSSVRLQPRNEKYPPQTLPADQLTGIYRAIYKYQSIENESDAAPVPKPTTSDTKRTTNRTNHTNGSAVLKSR